MFQWCQTELPRVVALHAGGERMESFWLAETLKYLYLLFR
jgi:hypothetical protein